MADFTTIREARRCLPAQDWQHRLGVRDSCYGKEYPRSPPLTLKELGGSCDEGYNPSRSPFQFQEPFSKESGDFDPIWPRCRVKELRSLPACYPGEETLRPLNPARRLYYAPFDTGSSPLPNGAVDIEPFDHMMSGRHYSSSCHPDTCQLEQPLHSLSERVGLGGFDVDLRVSLLDSGKKRAQLVGRLKEAHRLLEEQSAQLRKREDQLLESKTKIEMLSLKQKQLENSISNLEGEKNLLELSCLEDQKQSGSLKDKILHLEVEMAKAKSSLDLISRDHESMPSSPSRTLSLAKLEDAFKQEKESLMQELQSTQEMVRVYQERVKVLEEERDRAGEDLRNVHEAQHSVLLKTNEANQRLTDSLQAQTELHEELNEMRVKYNKASLARDLLAAKIERLEESVTNLKTKLEDVVADKDRFFQEKLELHKCVQHLTLELERALRGREGFDDQLADLHVELLNTKSQANRQDQEKVLLKEKLSTITQVNERLTAELGELRQTLGLRQEQLHHLEAERKILNNQIEALESERAQLIGEKETLLTAVQADVKAHDDEVKALKEHCEELRVSEAQLRERSKCLETELQLKAEELTMVTLEQGEVAQQWKEKWQETACALKAKEKELQLAAVKQLTKKEKAELLGDCEIFAADLEELIELRTALARANAEKAQLKRQQEESGRVIDLLQLQKDISGDSKLRGSSKFARSLESVQAELQKYRNQIHGLEKEKGEMEMELKKLKLQAGTLVRVELDACRQELELERSRSQKLQHQLDDLKRTNQLSEQCQVNQATVPHKMQSRQSGQPVEDYCQQETRSNNDKNQEDSLDHLSLKPEDSEEPDYQLPNQEPPLNSGDELLTHDLVKQISSLQQDLRDSKTTQRQQNAIIRGLREELEEANLNKPGEIKASLEEVDSELFQVREELQKVWDMLHMRNSKLEEQHQELESARGQISFYLQFEKDKGRSEVSVLQLNKGDYGAMREELAKVKWTDILAEKTVEQQWQFTECNSENQRLENLVTTLKQQVTEKEHALRQLERLRRTEKTEFEIKISAMELKLAEVDVLGEVQQESPRDEHKSYPLQTCRCCDSLLEKMNAKVQDYSDRNSELREEKDMALKSLNEAKILTQLVALAKEQEDLIKAYNNLPDDRKGETSLEYWTPRSHLVRNVGEMLKSQEEQQQSLEEQNQRLKDYAACQNFQKLEEEMQQLQHQLHTKRQKMAAMACEMESLKHRNEDLMKAQVMGDQPMEKSRPSSLAASGTEAEPRASDGRLASPWVAHSFQAYRPFNRRGRDLSPFRREDMPSPSKASARNAKVGQSYFDAPFSDQSSEIALHPEARLIGVPPIPLQPKGASTPDRPLSPLPLSRTPSPSRPNCPIPPLSTGKSSPDCSSASEVQNEEEKPSGRTMSSAVKCSLLLSPRPYNMHRVNLNKK
ncbi:uncharacterized protein [Hemitrygon akajei]|uniref:uncharacterized protein isoform X2 n=1 Tax=Hemitrygon akajei TaxID=2704970 RepID=UPI003BF9F4EE